MQPNPSDQLAPGEGFASGCCSGAVWEGTGSHGGDNPCLAVPRATTFHCSLGMRDLGLHLSGLQGKVKSWGGVWGRFHPCPPSPCCIFMVVEGEGAEGWIIPVQGVLGQGWGSGWASLLPLSLLYKADSLELS